MRSMNVMEGYIMNVLGGIAEKYNLDFFLFFLLVFLVNFINKE